MADLERNYVAWCSEWMEMAMLGVESQIVIDLRMTKLGRGGDASEAEFTRMVCEKAEAAWEAQLSVMKNLLAACRTHEINRQILKQMESTSTFLATTLPHSTNLDSFVSLCG